MSETSSRRGFLRAAGIAGVAPDEAAARVVVMEAMYEAARNGAWVDID
jgi:hypothetical protein